LVVQQGRARVVVERLQNKEPYLSIILPTFNETRSNVLPKILDSLTQVSLFELVVVDSHSEDTTLAILQSHPLFLNFPEKLKIISTDLSRRGEKLNLGLLESKGEMVVLHHPRSYIPGNGLNALFTLDASVQWGAFTHSFDVKHPLLDFTSFYSNFYRGRKKSIYYLDHCLFVRRSLLLEVGIPQVEIFEDTLLSLQLSKKYKPILLSNKSITSSIRFKKNGIYFQSILNQIMKIGFYLKIPLPILNRFYERSIELNSRLS
jgi:glycosyltransferase involved in cell wall biosynthesis